MSDGVGMEKRFIQQVIQKNQNFSPDGVRGTRKKVGNQGASRWLSSCECPILNLGNYRFPVKGLGKRGLGEGSTAHSFKVVEKAKNAEGSR